MGKGSATPWTLSRLACVRDRYWLVPGTSAGLRHLMENSKNGAGCCGKPLIRIALHIAHIAAHKQDVTKIMINKSKVHLISSYSCCCCVKSTIRSLLICLKLPVLLRWHFTHSEYLSFDAHPVCALCNARKCRQWRGKSGNVIYGVKESQTQREKWRVRSWANCGRLFQIKLAVQSLNILPDEVGMLQEWVLAAFENVHLILLWQIPEKSVCVCVISLLLCWHVQSEARPMEGNESVRGADGQVCVARCPRPHRTASQKGQKLSTMEDFMEAGPTGLPGPSPMTSYGISLI